jgi:hypothetical protein
MFAWMVWWAVEAARAQSCSCSVGGGDGVSPSGPAPAAGSVVVAVEYGARQTGGEDWDGFALVERGGNSMEGMAMPGHLVQTARANAIVGIGRGGALYAAVPWIDTHPLYPSDMPGDVDGNFLGDVALGARWGRSKGEVFSGFGGGLTLPTGKVLPGVRGGRGALGVTGQAEILDAITPHAEIGGALTAAASLYPAPLDGYLVGLGGSASAGVRLWPREAGRTRFDEFLVLQQQSNDRLASLILYETGSTAIAWQSAFWWKFWSDRDRSASVTVRGQVPIAQIVGDPWLSQNWSLSLGLSVVAF